MDRPMGGPTLDDYKRENEMKIKKMLLLALVALGLAVPASASATERWWYDHDYDNFPIETAKKSVTPHAILSITVGLTQYGPCTYQFTGSVWNKAGGMGEGSIALKEAVAPCPTSTLGCTVEASTVEPLALTLMTSTNLRLSPIKIELHLSPLCGAPATRTVTGTVEGQFIAPTTNGKEEWAGPTTVKFTKAPGLTVGGVAATLDGTLEFGTHFTAIAEP
jgi:hypothetical protein